MTFRISGGCAKNGNLQNHSIITPALALAQTYQYDDLNRLKNAQESAGQTQTWGQTFTYDRFGNRESATSTISPANPNLVIDPLTNRFDPSAQNQSLIQYDAAGNLKRGVGGNTYDYNAEGLMTSYNGGNPATGGATYSYDGDGRRVKKIAPEGSAVFVYNISGQMIAEYADTSTPGGTTYLTPDLLGTPRVTTNSAGSVKSRHDYVPFGDELIGTGNRSPENGYVGDDLRQKFTLKERDPETGLDFFQARYYASMNGRFTSPDAPFADQFPENPQSWNLYSYVRNNPLILSDPTGRRTGDYYNEDGSWSFSDGINDNRVYVLNATREADGSINLIPQLLLISHTEFRRSASIIRHEGASNDPEEYLWLAHTTNNEANAINVTFYDLLQTGFSSAPRAVKNTGMAISDLTVRATAARAGILHALAGRPDPTGGARRWDGTDFLAWGLNGPWGSHAKFREFRSIHISGQIFHRYEQAQLAAHGNSITYRLNGRTTSYTIPAAVFTDAANWTQNRDFHYVTGSTNRRNLVATGARGQSIFWRF